MEFERIVGTTEFWESNRTKMIGVCTPCERFFYFICELEAARPCYEDLEMGELIIEDLEIDTDIKYSLGFVYADHLIARYETLELGACLTGEYIIIDQIISIDGERLISQFSDYILHERGLSYLACTIDDINLGFFLSEVF